MDLHEMRKEYLKETLEAQDLSSDPFEQFAEWFLQAQMTENREVNAMVLSTVSASGQPSSRVVLLKSVDEGGFVFFTNYDSRKSKELQANPKVALVFWWSSLERQIRIEGEVVKITADNSDEYFNSRPLESRVSAIASPQSQIIKDRAELEELWANASKKINDDGQIERPANWGGWKVIPSKFEFWQGRFSRLHDRFSYSPSVGNSWKIDRLAP